ncbi:aminotransferase class IV [Lysobacter cavernae]|uniref:branched-chain-amino-acid transaminase n=1 Tax=Lysobacter cavernae TaxID=1685901 RepID=A0ABV7RQX7_9GAMM
MSVNTSQAQAAARQHAAMPLSLLDQQRNPDVPLLWFDGALAASDTLQVPLNTHAMHYGTGVFEGIRSYATRDGSSVFRLPEHLERMRKGADLLGIDFDVAQAFEATVQTLRANGHRDAYIRPLTWLGTSATGVSIGLDVPGLSQHFMVITLPTVVHLNGKRARLTVSPWKRNPASSLPPLKLCGAYVNSILAKHDSRKRGFDEALFVDEDGYVVECTGANVFMVRNGEVTAVEHRDALPGITRDTLIALTGATSRPVTHHELLDADEVFACGSAAEVAPISVLDRREFGDNPVTRELSALYARVVRGEEPQYAGWLTAV